MKETKDEFGSIFLILVVQKNYHEIFRILLKNGIIIEVLDKGRSILLIPVRWQGHYQVVIILLRNIVRAKNIDRY